MNTTPKQYGSNALLDLMYEELGTLEQKELDCISYGRLDLLPEIRKSMLPIKAQINQLEGFTIYEEAAQ